MFRSALFCGIKPRQASLQRSITAAPIANKMVWCMPTLPFGGKTLQEKKNSHIKHHHLGSHFSKSFRKGYTHTQMLKWRMTPPPTHTQKKLTYQPN